MQFSVVHGDIAEQRADALVNAAGTSLQMGSGVAGYDPDEGRESSAGRLRPSTPTTCRACD